MAYKEACSSHSPHDFVVATQIFFLSRPGRKRSRCRRGKPNARSPRYNLGDGQAVKSEKAQVKSRIQTVSNQRTAILGNRDLNVKITRIERQFLIQLASVITEQYEK